MPRPKTEIDREILVETITELEKGQPDGKFPSRNRLYIAVAERLNVPASIIPLRVKEFEIQINTALGKAGRAKNNDSDAVKKPAKTRIMAPENLAAIIADIPKELRPRFAKTIERVKKGSLKAKVKLHCCSCASYVNEEVRRCNVLMCVWHSDRPYK